MIVEKEHRIWIENNCLRAGIEFENGVRLLEFTNLFGSKRMNADRELFSLSIRGKTLSSDQFVLAALDTSQDKKQEMITLLLESREEALKVRIHLISDRADSITMLWQIYDGYKRGEPDVSRLHIPLLAQLDLGGEETKKYYPACLKRSGKGTDAAVRPPESFYSSDIRMPLVICDQREELGLSLEFQSLSDLSDEGAVQNVSGLLAVYIDGEEHLKDHSILINPDQSFGDTLELRVTGIRKGWPEAFERCRENWLSHYDLSEYGREDLDWFKTCAVHNFSFLFGKSAFDFENNKVDVKKILEEGEAFGGYDTVTIWNQYPRLGVDRRSQWDFYDDFPGGRTGLREMTDEFHRQGVKVLLPYIPWDRGAEESTKTMEDEFARIIADTDADGYQLDTCKELPYSFRAKLDIVRPGLLLQTQSHPYKNRPMEFITSSWDEFWHGGPMPEVDLLRFMLPQHLAPAISRWLRREDKTVLITRCIFNAAPIVIWQDIFGRMMPYSAEQKEMIKRWKQCYLKYREIYQGRTPIPLYPIEGEQIYCNRFVDDEKSEYIYSIYNDSDRKQTAALRHEIKAGASVIMGNGNVRADIGIIRVEIMPREVLHLKVD